MRMAQRLEFRRSGAATLSCRCPARAESSKPTRSYRRHRATTTSRPTVMPIDWYLHVRACGGRRDVTLPETMAVRRRHAHGTGIPRTLTAGFGRQSWAGWPHVRRRCPDLRPPRARGDAGEVSAWVCREIGARWPRPASEVHRGPSADDDANALATPVGANALAAVQAPAVHRVTEFMALAYATRTARTEGRDGGYRGNHFSADR